MLEHVALKYCIQGRHFTVFLHKEAMVVACCLINKEPKDATLNKELMIKYAKENSLRISCDCEAHKTMATTSDVHLKRLLTSYQEIDCTMPLRDQSGAQCLIDTLDFIVCRLDRSTVKPNQGPRLLFWFLAKK